MLLPEVAGRDVAPAVTSAARELRLGEADAVVLASPHGASTGVYAKPAGSLDAFGPRGIAAAAPTDEELLRTLADAWGPPVLDAPADHGIVVPLRLLGGVTAPVIAVTFAEATDGLVEGAALAAALADLDATVAFVASAHTSAGLTEHAPLPSLPGAVAAERAALDALMTDPRLLPDRLPALAAAGSCASGPLAALAFVLGERPCELRAYEHPFGVGYAVAVS